MRWPPIIDAGRLPARVVARDVLATACAWIVLLYAIRDLIRMVVYWAALALGFDIDSVWRPGDIWRSTLPFVKIVAMVVVWLLGFALVRRHLITSRRWIERQPEPLLPAQQARALGETADTVAVLRAARMATVHGIEGAAGTGSRIEVTTTERP